jgi:hypothetical protein
MAPISTIIINVEENQINVSAGISKIQMSVFPDYPTPFQLRVIGPIMLHGAY